MYYKNKRKEKSTCFLVVILVTWGINLLVNITRYIKYKDYFKRVVMPTIVEMDSKGNII